MTVAELKAILPEADVYSLDENSHYLVVVSKEHFNAQNAQRLAACEGLPKGTAIVSVLGHPSDAIRILELKA